MSIKSELKANLQKVREKQAEKDRNLDLEARKMIEEFIIPKFRKIAESQPTESYLRIEFHNNIGCWCYTSNIESWNYRKDSKYDYQVVCKAVEIAKDFDIEAKKSDDGGGGTTLSFTLDLDS